MDETAGTDAVAGADDCPVCAGRPRVLVGVAHPVARRLIIELLDREHGCWAAEPVRPGVALRAAVASGRPDLVVVDAADFLRCHCADLAGFPRSRVVVIGPEPDAAYRRSALRDGAGAWLPRDAIGEELSSEMRQALGCRHGPCPPDGSPRVARRASSHRSTRPVAGQCASYAPSSCPSSSPCSRA
jgi:DNA-binding NarL/FixJ family response regulator